MEGAPIVSDTYLHRNETGHLVPVHCDPPPPEQAILQAYAAAFHRPPPDSWRQALAELQRTAAAAQGTRPTPAAAPLAPLYDPERWETL